MSPIGPTYKAVSVREIRGKGTTWLTAKREGDIQELDGETLLNQIYEEVWFYMCLKLIFSSCHILQLTSESGCLVNLLYQIQDHLLV